MARRTALAVIFGILGPAACVLFDPLVFRVDPTHPFLYFSSAYLGFCQPFSYAAIFLGIVFLVLHLAGGLKSPLGKMALAGCLLASALFALALGVALLPYSLPGIFFVIGFFGFLPFVAAWVYARCGFETLTEAARVSRIRWGSVVGGALAFFAVAALFQLAFVRSYTHALGRLDSTDMNVRAAAYSAIRRWDYLFGHQHLIDAFQHAPTERARRPIADAYYTITGRNLEEELEVAAD
jgi:hypothetical protein